MKVVKPIPVTDDNFVSSSIPEPDAAAGEVEWIPDRFSGFLFTNKSYPDQGFIHAVKVGGTLYALETKEVNIGSNGVIHKYDNNGAHVGSFSVDGSIKSFGISEDLNRLVGVDPANGAVIEYNLSSESFVRSVSIAGDVSTPRGITYGDGSYFVLDSTEQKIARFDSNFNFQSRDTVLDDATSNLWSLNFLAGGFCSYVNSLTGELKAARIGSSDIQWKIPTSEAAGSNFSIFGHYYSDGNPSVLNFTEDKSYLYVDGIYDGLYKPSDRAVKSSAHKLYQCAIATSQDPEEGVATVPPTWVEVSPTNRWAMFDYKRSTQSESSSPLTISLDPDGIIDSVSVFDIEEVSTIKVVATSASSGEVYNQTHTVTGLVELVILDIPPFSDLVIDLTFTGGAMLVGEVVVGESKELGVLVSGVVSDRIDYSRTTYDDFGNVTDVPRPIVKYITYPIRMLKSDAPGIERYLDALRGSQAVWVGDIGGGDLIITFGRIERSPMTYDNPSIVEYQIKVRGSI